jgi:nanoRNase/pAp phosphatase (c-di-AMP/oligoRNAs hydrolase)
VELDVPLATALLYGIRSDTQDLGAETTQADVEAFLALYPQANKRMLSRIQRGRVPDDYFRMLATALQNARVYDDCVVTDLGGVHQPDMIGEVADLLLRRHDTDWVLSFGFFEDRGLFSLRTSDPGASAGELAHNIAQRLDGDRATGGGHGSLAAGQIPLDGRTKAERKRVATALEAAFLTALERDEAGGRKLVD